VALGDLRGAVGSIRDRRADSPHGYVTGFADILGFLFLLIGVVWMVQAFNGRPINDLWWLTLISGI
jgi:hypothetical protein